MIEETSVHIDKPVVVNVKHVFERNADQIFDATEISTTYKEFSIEVQPQKSEIGYQRYKFSTKCPVCGEELIITGGQTSAVIVKDAKQRLRLFFSIYLKTIFSGGTFLLLIMLLVFVFVPVAAILASFVITEPFALGAGLIAYLGTIAVINLLDARQEFGKHKMGGAVLCRVGPATIGQFRGCPVIIKMDDLRIGSGYPRHSFSTANNDEYVVAGEARKVNFLTYTEPAYIETTPLHEE